MKAIEILHQRLAEQLTTEQILKENDQLTDYGHDETEDLFFLPQLVVLPYSTEEVSFVVAQTRTLEIPLTVRGGGTGLSGGALPVRGGVVLSMEKMNQILEIDEENFFARVQAGIVTEEFQNQMEARDLFYPPDPASRGTCTLGGNIAENSGGPRAAKYGVTRNYLLGVRGVLADGQIFETGAPVIKNVSGYDLTSLICGSEGTLVIVTEATLRLISRPQLRKMVIAPFDSAEKAVLTVAKIYKNGVNPSVLEFLERAAILASEEMISEKWPVAEGAAVLFIELDGYGEAAVEEEMERLVQVLLDNGCEDAVVIEGSAKMANLWRLRRGVGEAVKSLSIYKEEDTVVPRARLHLLYSFVKKLEIKTGITAITYGHAGDGNLHVNILKGNLSDQDWQTKLPDFIQELFVEVIRLGGAITGEHGVGYTQKAYLPLGINRQALTIMKQIKTLFDPRDLFNPEKIF
jgi:glycolate oxidase